MGKKVFAHLVGKGGTPLCKLGCLCEIHHVTCGHTSLRSAREGAALLRSRGIFVSVVRGRCPEGVK